MHVTIFGKRWKLRFTKLPPEEGGYECHGECDPPETRNKEIRIEKRLGEKETLDVIIHEILHASDFYKTEDWIEPVASDIARILWRLGYRRKTEEEQ
jgi:hypothetical protein